MKKILLAAALISSFSTFAQTAESLAIGSDIPMGDLEVRAAVGKNTTLNKNKTNDGLLVMFSCNTCPYVVKSQARTKEMAQYAKDHKIGMVIVNSNYAQRGDADSYAAMIKYAKAQDYKVPYVEDDKTKLADAFGATRTPEVFLFDGNGKLMYKGAMEDNPSNPSESKDMFLKKAIDEMTAGRNPDPNSTKSIGCTIKRS